MSKKAYVGVNGIARNVKNIYVGVNGVARKVVKGYVGVNGVAQQFWGGGSTSTVKSWDYWTTLNSTEIMSVGSSNRFYKSQKGLAYYSFAYVTNHGNLAVVPILISPLASAVEFYARTSSGTTYYQSSGSFLDANNITWYYAYTTSSIFSPYFSPEDCVINTENTPYIYGASGIEQAAKDLVDAVYAVPSQSSYQIGDSYNLTATDIRRTLRKCISTALHRHINKYGTDVGYTKFSDSANSIVNALMNKISAKNDENGLVGIRTDIGSGYVTIDVQHGTTVSYGQNVNHLDNVQCIARASTYNYDRAEFYDSAHPYDEYSVYPDWDESVDIDSAITYATYDGQDTQIDSIPYYSGFKIDTNYGNPYYLLTNIGINL